MRLLACGLELWQTVALQLVYCAMPTSTFSLFSDAPFARRLRLHASQRRQESLRIAFQAHPMSDPAHFRGVDVPARVLPREARPSDPSRPKFAFSRLAYPPPPKNGNERLRTIRTLQAIGQMDSSQYQVLKDVHRCTPAHSLQLRFLNAQPLAYSHTRCSTQSFDGPCVSSAFRSHSHHAQPHLRCSAAFRDRW